MRAMRLLLAAWYLAAATGAVPVLLDGLMPQTKVMAGADFPCARYACGRRTAEQCRLHCCCVPKRAAAGTYALAHAAHTDALPRAVPVMRLVAAQCSGHTSDGAIAGSDRLIPHLPVAVWLAPSSLTVRRFSPERPAAHDLVFADPPETVPLARSS